MAPFSQRVFTLRDDDCRSEPRCSAGWRLPQRRPFWWTRRGGWPAGSARQEGQSVSQAAATFGFSRPFFYAAQALFEQAGLPGLVPQRPGPRRAHKLSEAVVAFLEERLAEDSSLRSSQLTQLLEELLLALGPSPQPRAGAGAATKKGAPVIDSDSQPASASARTEGYEALRAQACGVGAQSTTARGLALFLRSGLAAWMAAWRPAGGHLVEPTAWPPPMSGWRRFRLSPELAVVLTEMALSQQRRWGREHRAAPEGDRQPPQREAYLYVRQSTLRQVFENTESTKRQYTLRTQSNTPSSSPRSGCPVNR
jgi:Winged helix-turn helix